MPITLEEILKSFPELRGGQPTQGPLVNQGQSFSPPAAQPAVQQPTPQPTPMPSMPASLGQSNQGGGGLKSTLGNMAKSFLGTAANTLPTALANAAIFGDNPQSRQMTYSSMLHQLEEKKEAEERKRQDKIADISSAYVAFRKSAKDRGLDDETIGSAFLGGTQTGNQEVDAWTGQLLELMKANKIGASDAWAVIDNAKKYEELLKPGKLTDYELYEKDPEKYKEFKGAGKTPPKIDKYSTEGMEAEKDLIATRKKEEAKYRRPEKTETPSMREVWPTGGGESTWIRNDVAPPKGYTGIKPERPPKSPTPQQALKNIAQQEKIIYSLKNTGGIPAELLGNVSPETLKLLQGGDSSSAIQSAQDVVDYNRQFVGTQSKTNTTSSVNILAGKKAGMYEVNGKIVKWDGKKEIK
jgi:hypothetical protein